jgi:hypothetical protein
VAGAIPPNSLAVGSPAKVVRTAPDFPRRLDPTQRAALVQEMVAEFERFTADAGVTVTVEGAIRTYRRNGDTYRLVWARAGEPAPDGMPGDTILVEAPLSEEARAGYRRRGVHWIDLGAKTRSREGSPLTEELVLFLGRYGIRPARDR